MDAAIRSELDLMTSPQLARIWCALNNGEKPPELAAKFPANWDTLTGEARHRFIWSYMVEILDLIGLENCLREWNRECMTAEEFKLWWKGDGGRFARESHGMLSKS